MGVRRSVKNNRLAAVDGKRVRLGVDDELAQVQQLGVVGEEQVQVLERLAEEERLHEVLVPQVGRVLHVADRRVAVRHPRVLLEALPEDVPAPVLVRGVVRELVHVPQALQELGS